MAISSAGHIEPHTEALDAEFAAAMVGDTAARWHTLEACRDYLRLVVRRGRWSSNAGQPATSDIVQNTILDGWRGFARFEGVLTPSGSEDLAQRGRARQSEREND